jgi:hypothetical protein
MLLESLDQSSVNYLNPEVLGYRSETLTDEQLLRLARRIGRPAPILPFA